MLENEELTVATYNIQLVTHPEKILANIEEMAKSGVRIFCLQEIINIPGKDFIITQIGKRLGKEWEASYHIGTEYSKLSIGTAIIWHTKTLQLKAENKILLPKIKKFNLRERLFYKAIGVPGVSLQRKALCCDFLAGEKTIRITSVHLDNVGGPTHRLKQLSYLVTQLRGKTVIHNELICGDFNTFDLLKTGREKKLLQEALGNDFNDASNSIEWTADLQNIDFTTSKRIFKWFIKLGNIHIRRRLDYIWVKNFAVQSCTALTISGSDHLPIIAKLQFIPLREKHHA